MYKIKDINEFGLLFVSSDVNIKTSLIASSNIRQNNTFEK